MIKNKFNYISIFFVIILTIILLFIINNILYRGVYGVYGVYEHMSMKNTMLQETLKKNGYDLNTDDYTLKKCTSSNDCKKIVYGSQHFNSSESHYLAKNKNLSNKIFMENNIPVPEHFIINKNNKKKFLTNFNFPYPRVLKPVDGMQGTDVNTFIKTPIQYEKILNNLLDNYDEIMLENQVYGDNYRIFVFNNQVMDIIKREQPFIKGDGKTTLAKLIEIKNIKQIEKKLYATTNLDWNYMLEQGYDKNTIIPNDITVFITNTINFHNGANPVRVELKNVPRINLDMFVKAHKLIGLHCSGIDYMSDDITIPYNENDGHIIEINDMVDTKIHKDADEGAKPYLLFENITKSLENTFLQI